MKKHIRDIIACVFMLLWVHCAEAQSQSVTPSKNFNENFDSLLRVITSKTYTLDDIVKIMDRDSSKEHQPNFQDVSLETTLNGHRVYINYCKEKFSNCEIPGSICIDFADVPKTINFKWLQTHYGKAKLVSSKTKESSYEFFFADSVTEKKVRMVVLPQSYQASPIQINRITIFYP